MNSLHLSIAIIVAAYILGSIPFGLVISRVFYRTDIRKYGSGNIGATNVYRNLGPIAGAAVLAADILKSLGPVISVKFLSLALDPWALDSELVPLISVLAGLAAIFGHSYSIFLNFKGGKGMATVTGMALGLWPWTVLILFGIWLLIAALTKYVSLASITVVVLLPVMVSFMYPKTEYIIISIIAAVVIVYRHRLNIVRLLKGQEIKIGDKVKLEED